MAYALWEAEGRPHGRDVRHWQEAEIKIAGIEAAVANENKSSTAATGSADPAPKKPATKTTKTKSAGSASPAEKKSPAVAKKSSGTAASAAKTAKSSTEN
jgi:hypothetical protein